MIPRRLVQRILYPLAAAVIIVSFFSCSTPDELTANFRGDSPLFFNKTSVTLAESEQDSVALNLQDEPTAPVYIDLSIGDASEIEIEPAQLVFTADNYSTPQTITILAKDDCLADGTQETSISVAGITSADPNYSISDAVTIPVTVDDGVDNLPRIVFFSASEPVTSELATIAFFKVNLSCQPTANVTVPLTVDLPSEVVLNKTSLTFTPADYASYQTVTITGVSDCINDTDKTFTVKTGNVVSADTRFNRYSGAPPSTTTQLQGKNLNYPVTNDIILSSQPGSLSMTLNFSTSHPDKYISFYAKLTCPPPAPVFFSFTFTDRATPTIYSIANGFGEVINTSLGNKYLAFNADNYRDDQNVLIQLNSGIIAAANFNAPFINPNPVQTPVFTDSNTHKIKVYQSQGDAADTAVASPAYQSKTLNATITVNSW